jgi:hypothetical protein
MDRQKRCLGRGRRGAGSMNFLNFLCTALLLVVNSQVLCKAPSGKGPMIIFHVDLNSVSLRKDYIEKWLRKTSAMGYNAVLWEVEGMVKWETCPECASPDAFSKKEFGELLTLSRQLGLEPIPLLQTIGHAEYVLQHGQYVRFREKRDRYDCYCTSNRELRGFIKRWIEEYLDLFGEVNYFHLGGDEAYVFGTCPQCSTAVATLGINALYAEYLKDIAAGLLAKGIRPGIWDDMVMKKPNDVAAIPKDFVLWDWDYWDVDTTPSSVMVWSETRRVSKSELSDTVKEMIPEILDSNGELRSFYVSDFLKRKGFDVIACSSSRSHGDAVFTGRHSIHSGNIIAGARKCSELGLLGTCVTSWAVRLANYEIQEPWIMLAPLTMQHPLVSGERLLSMVSCKLFGVEGREFFDAIEDVGFPFPFSDQSTTGIMWTGMKDLRPAPEGYIKSLVHRWKTSSVWEANIGLIARASSRIRSGVDRLNRFLPKVYSGFNTVYAWSVGGNFQLWQALIAQAIVEKAKGEQPGNAEEWIEQIARLKKAYRGWAEEWMTPRSALQNSGLIYDAILGFFQE